MSSQADIMDLLKRCEDYDKDNRYMAALDLTTVLVKVSEHQKIEEALERRICAAFMKQLEDDSVEVSSNAVKSIQRCSSIVSETNLVMIVEKLSEMVTRADGKKEVRDVYSLAIRSTIQELGDKEGVNMIRAIKDRLNKGLQQGSDDIKEEVLEIWTEIFKKFGNLLVKNQNLLDRAQLMNQLCLLLASENRGVSKRATATLGHFAIALSQAQLDQLIQQLLARVHQPGSAAQTLTQLQSISQITRHVGDKLASRFDTIVPMMMNYAKTLSMDESNDMANEICEAALQSVEHMVLMCPTQASRSVNAIFGLVQSSITYDPNYQYDNDDDDAEMEDAEQDDDEGDGWSQDDDMDDDQDFDDDTAWKVRKSTVRIIEAIFASCPESVRNQWQEYMNLLADRFKERVVHVKIDILQTFQKVVRYSFQQEQKTNAHEYLHKASSTLKVSSVDIYNVIVDKALRQMKQNAKNVAVKGEVMKSLAEFAHVNGEKLEENFDKILPYIDASVEENNNDMISQSLVILKNVCRNDEPIMLSQKAQENSQRIAVFLSKALESTAVLTLSSTLNTAGRFFVQLRDMDGQFDPLHNEAIQTLRKAIWDKILKADIDQLVKQNSIIAMCQLTSVAYSQMQQNDFDDLVQVLADRLENEFTRMAALKGIVILATTGTGVITLQNLGNLSTKFISLMNNVEREIHLLTLEALFALMFRYSAQFNQVHAQQLQDQLVKFVSESDIQKTDLTLKCCNLIVRQHPTIQQNIPIFQAAAQFSGSSIIQGHQVVNNLTILFETGCAVNIIDQALTETLIQKVSVNSRSSAQIAAVIISKNNASLQTYVNRFMQVAQNQQASSEDKVKAVLCLGEIGTLTDLSQIQNIMETLSALFQDENDQVRASASIALGSITIGNTGFFLKLVFQMIANASPQQKYMFLSTMREIINNKPECLQPYLQEILPLYIEQAKSDEEAVRNIVAESIGKLYITHHNALQQMLKNSLNSQNQTELATIAKSLKYAAHKMQHDPHPSFYEFVETLIQLIGHQDLAIKKNSMDSLSQVAYNIKTKKCLQLNDRYLTLIQAALLETPIKKDLVVTVDLGPFKHVVDNGTPVRKSAFQLLENIAEKFAFNQSDVVDAVITGFQDTSEDVQTLCLNFMIRLTQWCPAQVTAKLDKICEDFNAIYAKQKTHLKGQAAQGAALGNQERAINLMRGVLRVTEALNRNQDAQAHPAFQAWLNNQVLENAEAPMVKEIYDKIARNAQFTF